MNLRHLILHNFWLKLISLGLASLIWLAVHYQIESDHVQFQTQVNHTVYKQNYVVPISVTGPPGDTRVFRITPKDALVTTVGEEEVLNKISAKNLTIYVDLTDFHALRSTNEELYSHAPADVSITGIQPTTVRVEQITPQ